MTMQKVEFEFPEGDEETKIEVEGSSAKTLGEEEVEVEAKEEKPKKEKEVEIEVVDDTPKADRGRKASKPPEDVTDDELEDYSEKVRKRIQHFSKGYHDERRAKEEAMRERKELESLAKKLLEENEGLQDKAFNSKKSAIENAKKSTASELEMAKKAYKTAYEGGDAEEVLAAQERLTTANIRADKIANYDTESLQRERSSVQIPESTVDVPTADPRAAEWASENTWFGDDDEMTAYAMGVHQKLVKQGVDTGSDEYYAAIDARMQKVFPEELGIEAEEEVSVDTETSKRRSNVVAPASRSTAPKKVRLTQTQVAIAKKLGVPLELYAKKVAEEMRKV
tara:strand:+ start:339 stop:1352 length:1014 start_codon:yes stop_codon:yes gene_type:complete